MLKKNLFLMIYKDIGANIGMYTVLVASMDRQVVAVDADPENLAYIRKSLDLQNTTSRVRLFSNAVSDGYFQMYPYSPEKGNPGRTLMKSREEAKDKGIPANIVGLRLSFFKTEELFFKYLATNTVSST